MDRGDTEIDKRSIFVGQLNQKTVTNALLWSHFEHYGPIANIELVNRYPTGPSNMFLLFMNLGEKPAFAFVQFFNEESAAEAVENEVFI
jgi:RNA recognition motif-containing protein